MRSTDHRPQKFECSHDDLGIMDIEDAAEVEEGGKLIGIEDTAEGEEGGN